MTPFDRILVPVDFSSHSAEAIRYAADISRRYGSSVVLLHVYHPVNYYLVPEGFVLYTPEQLTTLLSEFDRQLEAAKADALAAGAARVDTQLLQGVPVSEIVQCAEQGRYDLIVMGTHGRTGLKHALIGSVTEKVIRKAPCPVLTVRAPEPH